MLDASQISQTEEESSSNEIQIPFDAIRNGLIHCQFLLGIVADKSFHSSHDREESPRVHDIVSIPGEKWSLAVDERRGSGALSGLRLSLALLEGPTEQDSPAVTMSLCIASVSPRFEADWLTSSAPSQSGLFPKWILPGMWAKALEIPLEPLVAHLQRGDHYHVVLTGHGVGGSLAACATLRLLELIDKRYTTALRSRVQCVTFGEIPTSLSRLSSPETFNGMLWSLYGQHDSVPFEAVAFLNEILGRQATNTSADAPQAIEDSVEYVQMLKKRLIGILTPSRTSMVDSRPRLVSQILSRTDGTPLSPIGQSLSASDHGIVRLSWTQYVIEQLQGMHLGEGERGSHEWSAYFGAVSRWFSNIEVGRRDKASALALPMSIDEAAIFSDDDHGLVVALLGRNLGQVLLVRISAWINAGEGAEVLEVTQRDFLCQISQPDVIRLCTARKNVGWEDSMLVLRWDNAHVLSWARTADKGSVVALHVEAEGLFAGPVSVSTSTPFRGPLVLNAALQQSISSPKLRHLDRHHRRQDLHMSPSAPADAAKASDASSNHLSGVCWMLEGGEEDDPGFVWDGHVLSPPRAHAASQGVLRRSSGAGLRDWASALEVQRRESVLPVLIRKGGGAISPESNASGSSHALASAASPPHASHLSPVQPLMSEDPQKRLEETEVSLLLKLQWDLFRVDKSANDPAPRSPSSTDHSAPFAVLGVTESSPADRAVLERPGQGLSAYRRSPPPMKPPDPDRADISGERIWELISQQGRAERAHSSVPPTRSGRSASTESPHRNLDNSSPSRADRERSPALEMDGGPRRGAGAGLLHGRRGAEEHEESAPSEWTRLSHRVVHRAEEGIEETLMRNTIVNALEDCYQSVCLLAQAVAKRDERESEHQREQEQLLVLLESQSRNLEQLESEVLDKSTDVDLVMSLVDDMEDQVEAVRAVLDQAVMEVEDVMRPMDVNLTSRSGRRESVRKLGVSRDAVRQASSVDGASADIAGTVDECYRAVCSIATAVEARQAREQNVLDAVLACNFEGAEAAVPADALGRVVSAVEQCYRVVCSLAAAVEKVRDREFEGQQEQEQLLELLESQHRGLEQLEAEVLDKSTDVDVVMSQVADMEDQLDAIWSLIEAASRAVKQAKAAEAQQPHRSTTVDDAVRRRMQRMEHETAEIALERDLAEQQSERLRLQCAKQQAELDVVQAECSKHRVDLHAEQTAFRRAADECAAAVSELESLAARCDALLGLTAGRVGLILQESQGLGSVVRDWGALVGEHIESHRRMVQAMEEEARETQRQLQRTAGELEQAAHDLETAREETRRQAVLNEQLTRDLERKEQETASAREAADVAMQEAHRLGLLVTQLQAERDEAGAEANVSRNECQDHQARARLHEEDTARLRFELQESARALRSMEDELRTLRSSVEQEQNLAARLTAQVDEQARKAEANLQENLTLRTALEQDRTRAERLSSEAMQAARAVEQRDEQVQSLRDALEQERAQAARARQLQEQEHAAQLSAVKLAQASLRQWAHHQLQAKQEEVTRCLDAVGSFAEELSRLQQCEEDAARLRVELDAEKHRCERAASALARVEEEQQGQRRQSGLEMARARKECEQQLLQMNQEHENMARAVWSKLVAMEEATERCCSTLHCCLEGTAQMKGNQDAAQRGLQQQIDALQTQCQLLNEAIEKSDCVSREKHNMECMAVDAMDKAADACAKTLREVAQVVGTRNAEMAELRRLTTAQAEISNCTQNEVAALYCSLSDQEEQTASCRGKLEARLNQQIELAAIERQAMQSAFKQREEDAAREREAAAASVQDLQLAMANAHSELKRWATDHLRVTKQGVQRCAGMMDDIVREVAAVQGYERQVKREVRQGAQVKELLARSVAEVQRLQAGAEVAERLRKEVDEGAQQILALEEQLARMQLQVEQGNRAREELEERTIKVGEFEMEVGRLQRELQDAKTVQEQLQQRVGDVERLEEEVAESKRLREAQEEQARAIEGLEEEMGRLQQEAEEGNSLRSKLSSCHDKEQSLQAEISALQEDRRRCLKLAEQLEESSITVKTQLAEIERLQQSSEEAKAVKGELERSLRTIAAHESEMKDLKEQVEAAKGVQEELLSCARKLNGCEEENMKLQQHVELGLRWKEQFEESSNQVKGYVVEVARLQSEVDAGTRLKAKLDDSAKTIQEHETEIRRLEVEIHEGRRAKEELRQSTAEVERLEREVEYGQRLREELGQNTNQMKGYERELGRLEREVEEANRVRRELEERLRGMQSREAEAERLQREVAEAKGIRDDLEETVATLRMALESRSIPLSASASAPRFSSPVAAARPLSESWKGLPAAEDALHVGPGSSRSWGSKAEGLPRRLGEEVEGLGRDVRLTSDYAARLRAEAELSYRMREVDEEVQALRRALEQQRTDSAANLERAVRECREVEAKLQSRTEEVVRLQTENNQLKLHEVPNLRRALDQQRRRAREEVDAVRSEAREAEAKILEAQHTLRGRVDERLRILEAETERCALAVATSEAQVQALRRTAADWPDVRRSLEEEAAGLRSAVHTHNKKVAALQQAQADATMQGIVSLELTIAGWEEVVEQLISQLEASRMYCRSSSASQQQLRAALDDATSIECKLRQQLSAVLQELEETTTRCAALQTRIDASEQRAAQLEGQAATSAVDIAEQVRGRTHAEEECDKLRRALQQQQQASEEALRKLRSASEQREEEVSSLRSALAQQDETAREEVRRVKAAAAWQTAEVRGAQEQLRGWAQAQLGGVQATAARCEASLARLEQDATAQQASWQQGVDSALGGLDKVVARCMTTLSACEDGCAMLRQQQQAGTHAQQKVREETAEMRREMEAERQHAQDEVDRAHRLLEAQDANMQSYQEELNRAVAGGVRSLMADVEQCVLAMGLCTAEMAQLQAEADSTVRRCESAQSELVSALQEKLEGQEREMEDMAGHLRQTTSALAATREQLMNAAHDMQAAQQAAASADQTLRDAQQQHADDVRRRDEAWVEREARRRAARRAMCRWSSWHGAARRQFLRAAELRGSDAATQTRGILHAWAAGVAAGSKTAGWNAQRWLLQGSAVLSQQLTGVMGAAFTRWRDATTASLRGTVQGLRVAAAHRKLVSRHAIRLWGRAARELTRERGLRVARREAMVRTRVQGRCFRAWRKEGGAWTQLQPHSRTLPATQLSSRAPQTLRPALPVSAAMSNGTNGAAATAPRPLPPRSVTPPRREIKANLPTPTVLDASHGAARVVREDKDLVLTPSLARSSPNAARLVALLGCGDDDKPPARPTKLV